MNPATPILIAYAYQMSQNPKIGYWGPLGPFSAKAPEWKPPVVENGAIRVNSSSWTGR